MSEISEIRKDSEVILDLEIENQQLKARVARLEEAMSLYAEYISNCDQWVGFCKDADLIANETPKQSLADIKAEVIREAARAVYNQFNKWGAAQIFLNQYADQLQAEGE
jgi:hypothetical protein